MCENGQNTWGHIKLDEKTEVSDGSRLAPKNAPRERKKSVLLAAQESPRPERFRRRHPKAHPDSGMT